MIFLDHKFINRCLCAQIIYTKISSIIYSASIFNTNIHIKIAVYFKINFSHYNKAKYCYYDNKNILTFIYMNRHDNYKF